MEVLRGVSAIYAKQNGINAINNKNTERERERETRKRDAKIEGTEDAILLGLSATLKYR